MSSGPQLVVQMSSDEAKLYQGFQKLIEQQARFQAGFDKTGKAAKQAEKDVLDLTNIGKEAVADIAGMATGWISVQGAIAGATAVLKTYQDLQEKAKKTADDLADARRQVNQIAGSPEQLSIFKSRSDSLASKYGVSRRNVLELQANASNFGFADDAGFLERAVQAEGMNVAPAAVIGQTGGKLSSLWSGLITPAQAVNAAFKAAQKSELSFEQMAPVIPKAAASAVPQGSSPEEVIGALGVLVSRFGSPEETSTRFSRLASELSAHDEFAGKGVVGPVEAIAKRGKGAARDIFGESKEAMEGFNNLLKVMKEAKEEISSVREAINTTGTAQDTLTRQIAIVGSEDRDFGGGVLAARQRMKSAEISEEIQTEQMQGARPFNKAEAESLRQQSISRRYGQGLQGSAVLTMDSYINTAIGSGFGFASDEWYQRNAAQRIAVDNAASTGGSAANINMFRASMEEVTKVLREAAQEFHASAAASGKSLQRQGASFAE